MKAPRPASPPRQTASQEVARLQSRLAEATATIDAIRSGIVDTVAGPASAGARIYTLEGAADPYRLLIESMNEGALTLTTDKLVLHANRCFARMVRRPLEQVIGASFREFLAVEDRAPLRAMLHHAGQAGFRVRLSLHASDGSTLPVLVSFRSVAAASMSVPGVAMVVTDMTEAHRTEALLRELAHRSVRAQESERRRIAVELHGNITQMLCAVMVRSQTLADRLAPGDPVARKEAGELRDLVAETAEMVERIARDLRPGTLHHVGLPAVLRSEGAAFAERTGLAVEVICRPLAARLSAGAALACHRIVQEALKNIEEHARARTVRILLERRGAAAILTVRDDGVGFGPARHKAGTEKGHGSGLLGMAERASCVGGQLSVVSSPGKGTTIHVSVPVRGISTGLPSPRTRLPVPSLS